ncbi:formylmethanofuran dehydrogenase [Segnochrobactrum spirostomi]|uniref:Formylmethanofuran dehydrogenase n=1 Tax=Segnochrobactrum spirostomi TaxID=2608987 RepID=A0A6A7XYH2_9HYPH|nr:formylmethanofuran dehydrogenase [Segnochrobactrum spirostomi]MQT11515.1 formylmethanofuran dehydrogenase [Segnochrobactrum spirostomi]
MSAFVGGEGVSLDQAAKAAAVLLEGARFPVVAGLGTCVEGARAALRLASDLRGAYDHMESTALARASAVLATTGLVTVTPAEARQRADVVVLIAPQAGDVAWLGAVFGPGPSTLRGDTPTRRLLIVGGDHHAVAAVSTDGAAIEHIPLAADDVGPWLLALRARIDGRLVAARAFGEGGLAKIDAAAATLRAARYGVVVGNAAHLGDLTLEAAAGLVADLNLTTRFAALPLPAADDGSGVLQVSGWTTGFPPRTGLRQGFPVHDSWAFEAKRLVESGEADAALWISALSDRAPDWEADVPLVALVRPGAALAKEPAVRIEVAEPGVEHPAALFDPLAAALVAVGEGRPARPTVAEAIAAIRAALTAQEAVSC